MSGFLNKLKDKALSMTGIEDKAADALKNLLASEMGQAGVERLIQQFDKAGLGDKARSWVGPGPRQPLTTEEVQRVLTSDQAKFLASCTGLPLAPLLPVIAKLLPLVIAKMATRGETGDQAIEEVMNEIKGQDTAAS
ncbi:YidB family protein [Acetobacter sp. AN02]|uniref:YidB family protein n=1 Tax=Acetobacter sp. AN02 TaxID=2894186 RepID=UPI0024343F9E|nr:YidB family protein [Acetobacter sp. AN02]MDG6094503.1 YidB family protein [Acetobacter sp. AN02]